MSKLRKTILSKGAVLAAGGQDHTLRLYDVVSGQKKMEIAGHTGLIHAVAFSPDGRWVASGAEDGMIRIGDTASGKVGRVLDFPGVCQIAFSPDGKFLGAMAWCQRFKVWNTATGTVMLNYGQPEKKCDSVNFAFSPDSQSVALALRSCSVKLLTIATGQQEREIQTSRAVYSVAYRNDGKLLAIGMVDCVVDLWSLIEGKPVLRVLKKSGINYRADCDNGRLLQGAGESH